MSVNTYVLGLFERGSTTEYRVAGQTLVVVRDSDEFLRWLSSPLSSPKCDARGSLWVMSSLGCEVSHRHEAGVTISA